MRALGRGSCPPFVLTVRLVLPAEPQARRNLLSYRASRLSTGVGITAAPPPLDGGQPGAAGRTARRRRLWAAASRTAAPSRCRPRPAPRSACGARLGGRRPARQARGAGQLAPWLRSSGRIGRAPAEARPRGAGSGPASTGGAQRRLGLAPGPLPAAASGVRQPRTHRARPSAHAPRQPQRAVVTPHAQSRVPARCMHRRRTGHAGGKAPRDPPAPLRPGCAAPPPPVRGHARHGQPARAAQHPGASAPGSRCRPGRPERAWLRQRAGAAAALIESAAPRPGGPSCARPLRRCWRRVKLPRLAPPAAGRRTPRKQARPGVRLARRAGAAPAKQARRGLRPSTPPGARPWTPPLAGAGLNPARSAARRKRGRCAGV